MASLPAMPGLRQKVRYSTTTNFMHTESFHVVLYSFLISSFGHFFIMGQEDPLEKEMASLSSIFA